jgi:hypothetical protein
VDSNHHIRTEIDETRALNCELKAGGVAFFFRDAARNRRQFKRERPGSGGSSLC